MYKQHSHCVLQHIVHISCNTCKPKFVWVFALYPNGYKFIDNTEVCVRCDKYITVGIKYILLCSIIFTFCSYVCIVGFL